MQETSKLIDIIKDIEITIISKIYADLMYRHDGFGRPTSYNHLARFHKKLSSLPSMVKVKEEHDKIEKYWIAANPDYEFYPIFRTIKEMKERGKEMFIKEKEGKDLEL